MTPVDSSSVFFFVTSLIIFICLIEQWEFQVGPAVGITAGDQLWVARYILEVDVVHIDAVHIM